MRRTLHYELLSCDIVVRQSHAINRTRDIGLNAKSLIYIMQINEKKTTKSTRNLVTTNLVASERQQNARIATTGPR